MIRVTHIIMDINVIHALAVEFLLHIGDGSIVPWDPIDARVFKPSLFHQLTTDLHNHRHKLDDGEKPKIFQLCFTVKRKETLE